MVYGFVDLSHFSSAECGVLEVHIHLLLLILFLLLVELVVQFECIQILVVEGGVGDVDDAFFIIRKLHPGSFRRRSSRTARA